MILVPDTPNKKEQEVMQERANEGHTEDPPPEYTTATNQVGSSSTRPLPRYLPDLKPSNFIHLSRANASVKGTWIIDPSMVIPSSFLAPLAYGQTEESRNNISLESKNGGIDAEIYLMPTTNDSLSTMAHRQRVFFHAFSHNGSVTMKIHEVPSQNIEEARLPLNVSCFSSNGSVHIYIPRSFQGPISVQTRNGSLYFSEPVKQLLTSFSEMNGAQRSFLGDFDAHRWQSGQEWPGDVLTAESKNGSVKVYFDDEGASSSRPKSQGFLGKLFGF